MKPKAFSSACVILLWGHSVLAAEMQECVSVNRVCLERNYEIACRERSATMETCTVWLGLLEQLPGSDKPVARLVIAATHMALADLSTVTETGQRFQEQGLEIYRDLVAEDPSNVQALLGLAAASDNVKERMEFLRRAVAADPTQIIALRSLASELAQIGGSERTLEAAQLLEQAYAAQSGPNKWHLAAAALSRYQESGLADSAIRFRQRVREDIGVDRMLAELDTRPRPDAVSVSRVLSLMCYSPVLSVIGAADCLAGIESVLNSVADVADHSKAQQLADGAAAAMIAASEDAWRLEEADPDWRIAFQTWIESLLTQGFESPSLYRAYAMVTIDEKQLMALHQAFALAPTDGEASLRLSVAYLERGMWKDAIRQLRKTEDLLPESRGNAIEYYLEVAADGIAKGNEEREE